MRPQDIVILLKIVSMRNGDSLYKQIAEELFISAAEVTHALERCRLAKLIDNSKQKVNTLALEEFLVHGLKYVYPVAPQSKVRGIATAFSAPILNDKLSIGEDVYVWPTPKGDVRGFAITPLYKTVPEVARADKRLYDLLAIADIFRIGRAREVEIAKEELKNIFSEYNAR